MRISFYYNTILSVQSKEKKALRSFIFLVSKLLFFWNCLPCTAMKCSTFAHMLSFQSHTNADAVAHRGLPSSALSFILSFSLSFFPPYLLLFFLLLPFLLFTSSSFLSPSSSSSSIQTQKFNLVKSRSETSSVISRC